MYIYLCNRNAKKYCAIICHSNKCTDVQKKRELLMTLCQCMGLYFVIRYYLQCRQTYKYFRLGQPYCYWPMFIAARRLDGWSWYLAWRYRPQPRRLCVRWGPSPLPPKGAEPLVPKFSAHLYCGETIDILRGLCTSLCLCLVAHTGYASPRAFFGDKF